MKMCESGRGNKLSKRVRMLFLAAYNLNPLFAFTCGIKRVKICSIYSSSFNCVGHLYMARFKILSIASALLYTCIA